MDDENPPPSRPYRIRRSSSSLISSTTSPMFSAPPTPTLQPPPSPMAHHSRHRHTNSNNNNNGAISQNNSSNSNHNNNNSNFGPGDIDDDVQPSSSSSPFPPPSPRPRAGGASSQQQQQVVAGPSSSFNRNSGPQSPLSSPDSTFWGGAAPSPSPVNHNSYRGGPSTPGGMCVVSSSTIDDVPPSPFSPAEEINNGNHIVGGSSGNAGNSSHSSNNSSNNVSANLNSVNNLLNNPVLGGPVAGPSGSGGGPSTSGGIIASNNGSLLVHQRVSQLIVASGNSSSNSVNNSNNQQQNSALISQLNQDVNRQSHHNNNSSATESHHHHQAAATASASLSSSQNATSPTFNMSPLRNKIKKASSFERFSQAQAASGGNNSSRSTSGGISTAAIVSSDGSGPNSVSVGISRAGGGEIISNEGISAGNAPSNNNNSEQQPISSLPLSIPSNPPASSSTIISRLTNNWEPVVTTAPSPAINTSSTSTSSTSSFRLSQNVHFGGDKSHIKIPSKKLAAKIASVFEQEQQLNEASVAASSSVANIIQSTSSATSSINTAPLGQSHHQQQTHGIQQSTPSVVQSYLGSSSSSSSLSQTSASANANSTLSQMLNEAPAHHLTGMGSLMSAAEEQIMSHHQHPHQHHHQAGVHTGVVASSHENLIRELSESPLNLTESSSNNHNSSSNSSNNNLNTSQHHHLSHSHHSQQSQSVLTQRNPVISSSPRVSLINTPSSSAASQTYSSSTNNSTASSSTNLLLSKKIPLTPKQKLLHRIQSGAGAMSPPPEPQPQPPPPPPVQQSSQSPLQQQLPSPIPQQQHQVLSSLQHHQLQQQQPSPSPPHNNVQQLSQQLQQASISTALSTIQSTSSLQSVNLSLVQQAEQLQQNTGTSHLILSSGGPHSPNSQLDAYSYDALLRAREDLAVQEALGKIIEDPNNVNNMSYDSPEMYAYCQTIMNDEIFANSASAAGAQQAGGGSLSNRQTIQLQQTSLQDPNDVIQQQGQQHQGQIEFVLGLDDHDRNVGRPDDMSLGGDGGGQQQFLDPNDLAAMKSHTQTDSTLRNLLMMDSSRYVATEDAWILADYQNRILSTDFNSRASSSSSIRNGMFSGGNVGNGQGITSASVMGINGLPTSGVASWNNDTSWQRTSIAASSSTWQHHSGVSVDQDEVMDMSMIEPNKGNSSSASGTSGSVVVTKRISQLHAAYGDQGMEDVNLVSDRDLATGLPLLQNMPISMAMDLQQPLGILQNTSGGSANSLKNALLSQANGIPMDLQQHHKILSAGSSMDMDDQPVNLMAVNLEQELAHHSNSASSVSHHHHHHQQDQPQQHSAAHLLPHHLAEVKSLGSSNSAGNEHSNQQSGSYTLQIHQQQQASSQHAMQQGDFHHSQQQQQQQQQHLVSVGNLSPILDNIDERRVIRVKKAITKEGFSLGQEDVPNGLPPPNIIPDKPVQPKSHASLPAPLQLIKIGNGDDELAVFTRNKPIQANTRFGPVEGSLKKACAEDIDTMNAVYPCLIISDHQNIVWRVDRDDDDCCNWTKFVRMAHSIKDQNALISEGEHDGMLYFTTCKEILPRTELQVGFSFEYAQKYGLPYLLPLPNTTNSSNNSSSGGAMLDDGKLGMSHFQQQQQQQHQSHNSAINSAGVPTVIHGSQNFIHHQQQQHQQMHLQKSLEEESLLMHQSHHSMHQGHPPQAVSVSPETTSAVLASQQQQHQTHQPQAELTPPPPAQPQPPQKSVIVESYQCFECDQEFQDVALLQDHLEKMHKEPEIRRPKKKAIKKYQQQLQQQQQNSAVSTTNNNSASAVATAEIMDTSFSFAVGQDENHPNASGKLSSQQQHQSGKVDSSSQSNTVDSSDPLSMGNLPVTKKRKAASSMKAMSASSSSATASANVTSLSAVSTESSNVGSKDGSAFQGSKDDSVVSSAGRGGASGDKKSVANSSVISGGVGFDADSDNHLNEPQQMQVDGGNDTDVTASQPPAKVKCTMCYKSFATKERLDRHMIVHSDEDTKPLKCPFCPKRFLTNSALAGHIKTHAEEGKCFECPICNFSTQQLLQLKEHVQTHKSRDSGLFHCPQCPKKFSAYSMIRKHIRAFHGPRQYECEQCPMSFPTSDKLKLHKLKHSDHREFLCAECGRQFKRKDKLREHTKRIHETKRKAIELTLPKDKSIKKFLPKISPEEYERFIYKCSECMVGFKRRGMLVNHLAKRHPEKPPQQVPELNMPIVRPTRNYFCLYCDRVYKSSSKRKAHIMKAHPGKPVPPQARSKDIPQQLATFIDPQPLQPGTVVQTLTDDGNNTARAGVVSSNVTSTRLAGGTVSTSTLAAAVRRETVVGKVVAQPHGCQWCHRQYATRAKLLQHQRKAHIHLMPPDMQMPRTQKNNVMRKEESAKSKSSSISIKTEQDSVISSNVASTKLESPSSSSPRASLKGIPQGAHNNSSTTSVVVTQSTSSSSAVGELASSGSVFSVASQAPSLSSSTNSIISAPVTTTNTTAATIQAIQAEGLPFQTEEGGLVGILVTQVGPNGELGNLVQGDVPIVMLTTQPVSGSSAGATTLSAALQGVNFSVLQTGQVANLSGGSGGNTNTVSATPSGSSQTTNNGTNASPNIISISSTNNPATTANLDNTSSTGIITLNTGSSGNSSSNGITTTVARNVIQHHQSSTTNNNSNTSSTSGNNNNSEQNGSSSSSSSNNNSSSSGVISTTGKL